MANLFSGLIRITKIPDGEAPEIVRQAWVGLELPCHLVAGFSGPDAVEVITKQKVAPRYGFTVPQDQALSILAEKHPGAATWWKKHGFPEMNRYFNFEQDSAEIISGVTFQKIRVVNDLDHPHGIGANCIACNKKV